MRAFTVGPFPVKHNILIYIMSFDKVRDTVQPLTLNKRRTT